MTTWRCRVESELKQWRKDPDYIPVLPATLDKGAREETGPNGEVRPADMNQLAKCIVDLATGQTSEETLKRSH